MKILFFDADFVKGPIFVHRLEVYQKNALNGLKIYLKNFSIFSSVEKKISLLQHLWSLAEP